MGGSRNEGKGLSAFSCWDTETAGVLPHGSRVSGRTGRMTCGLRVVMCGVDPIILGGKIHNKYPRKLILVRDWKDTLTTVKSPSGLRVGAKNQTFVRPRMWPAGGDYPISGHRMLL